MWVKQKNFEGSLNKIWDIQNLKFEKKVFLDTLYLGIVDEGEGLGQNRWPPPENWPSWQFRQNSEEIFWEINPIKNIVKFGFFSYLR